MVSCTQFLLPASASHRAMFPHIIPCLPPTPTPRPVCLSLSHTQASPKANLYMEPTFPYATCICMESELGIQIRCRKPLVLWACRCTHSRANTHTHAHTDVCTGMPPPRRGPPRCSRGAWASPPSRSSGGTYPSSFRGPNPFLKREEGLVWSFRLPAELNGHSHQLKSRVTPTGPWATASSLPLAGPSCRPHAALHSPAPSDLCLRSPPHPTSP